MVAATFAQYYAGLPTLNEADASLSNVDWVQLKQQIVDLLKPHRENVGFALVHHHFKLESDEMMVEGADGVMRPHKAGGNYFPKRWDGDGNAYEFATEPQAAIPAELFEAFRAIVPEGVHLGLYSRVGDGQEQLVEIPDATDRSHRMFQRTPEHEGATETTWWIRNDTGALEHAACIVNCHWCLQHGP